MIHTHTLRKFQSKIGMLTAPRITALLLVGCLYASNRAYERQQTGDLAAVESRRKHTVDVLRNHII